MKGEKTLIFTIQDLEHVDESFNLSISKKSIIHVKDGSNIAKYVEQLVNLCERFKKDVQKLSYIAEALKIYQSFQKS